MINQSIWNALLATGRVSNIPTVASNVIVAFLFVRLTSNQAVENSEIGCSFWLHQSPFVLFGTILIASIIYVGGCFFGDAVDAKFDAKHKPERPIPSGTLKRTSVITAALLMLLFGLISPFFTPPLNFDATSLHLYTLSPFSHWATLMLILCITAYSVWHKRSPWIGLPLIGSCRFFLVLYAAGVCASSQELIFKTNQSNWLPIQETFSYLTPQLLAYSCSVGLYTILFASVARSESSPKPISGRKALIAAMLLLPVIGLTPSIFDFLVTQPNFLWLPVILAFSITFVWTALACRRINHNKGQFVSRSLAGFCLLDACFAACFGWQWLLLCLGLFLLALLLQKIAPAT